MIQNLTQNIDRFLSNQVVSISYFLNAVLQIFVFDNAVEDDGEFFVMHSAVVEMDFKNVEREVLVVDDEVGEGLAVANVEFHSLYLKLILLYHLIVRLHSCICHFAILKEVNFLRGTVLIICS